MAPTKTQPTFAFAASSNVVPAGRGRKGGRQHRRSYSEDTDNTDGAGSLTYSATSSVQSGGSAAGESTDSSFADIMRVLDLQDSDQLKEFIKKEGCTSVDELQKKRGWSSGGGGVSVASSLAYSTDAESHLEGTKLLQTITGQPSDSYAFDGGGVGDESMDLLFAPAAPAVVKKTKGKKVYLRKDKSTKTKRNKNGNGDNYNNNNFTTPKSESNTRKSFDGDNIRRTPEQQRQYHHRHYHHAYSSASPSPTKSTPTKSPPASTSSLSSGGGPPGTPPLPSRKYFTKDGSIIWNDEDDIWYKEWWMSCFPDAFKNLMPKR